MLAAIRPDNVNLPLFLHVLGAMLLVGVLLAVTASLLMARSADGDGSVRFTRFGLRTLLYFAFPSYLLMRIGAQWTEAEEDIPEGLETGWLDIGYITADLGALLVIISMVLSARGLRRLPAAGEGGRAQASAVTAICVIMLVAYLVAIWAMSAKPS